MATMTNDAIRNAPHRERGPTCVRGRGWFLFVHRLLIGDELKIDRTRIPPQTHFNF
jgi:hypothetical protein